MPPKRKGGAVKASAAKKTKTTEESTKLKQDQPVLYIECSLHREITTLLLPLKSDLELQLAINADGPPRRGSFEVSIANVPSEDVEERSLIWTGLKNTPRAAKFPSAENIAKELKVFLKLVEEDQLKKKEDKSPATLISKDVDESKENSVEASPIKKAKRGRPKKK
ncbi:Selenoprotein BthD [Lucilia cuprina]|nr:Selenoprotein BthD [Lucilia cuprina]